MIYLIEPLAIEKEFDNWADTIMCSLVNCDTGCGYNTEKKIDDTSSTE